MRPIVVMLLLALAGPVASQSDEDVMIHAYPRDGAFHYAPARIQVEPGTRIVLGHLFGNHSMTSVDGLFNATGNATHWPSIEAPQAAGTYRFYCWIQATATTEPGNGMAADLVVAAEDEDGSGARSTPLPAVGFLLSGVLAAAWLRHRRKA